MYACIDLIIKDYIITLFYKFYIEEFSIYNIIIWKFSRIIFDLFKDG